MNEQEAKKSVQPLEDEGSFSAKRRYNQHLGDAVTSDDLEAGAELARRALEASEGRELERAAGEATKEPKGAGSKGNRRE